MTSPKRIFLVGYMGCGKTYTGKRLARKYNVDFVDLDAFIEQRYFKTISKIFEEKGESEFRRIEKNMLEEVSQFENVIISTGGGTACFFENMEKMNEVGETVYLQATPQELFDYLKNARQNRPLLRDKTDEELLQFITDALKQREPFYLKAKHVVGAADKSDVLFDQLLLDK